MRIQWTVVILQENVDAQDGLKRTIRFSEILGEFPERKWHESR
jgi:hypothetical protein